MLTSHNIRLRALEPTDLDLLYEWENDISTWKITSTKAPLSKYKLWQYLESSNEPLETGSVKLIIELSDSYTPIGTIELYDLDVINKRAAIGILIASEAHKRHGYATESIELIAKYAQDVFNLHQLYAFINETNEQSFQLFKKCGFLHTSTLKDWICEGGKYSQQFVMQLIF